MYKPLEHKAVKLLAKADAIHVQRWVTDYAAFKIRRAKHYREEADKSKEWRSDRIGKAIDSINVALDVLTSAIETQQGKYKCTRPRL